MKGAYCLKKVTSLARDFFTRADILLLVLCTVCTVFGIVVISSATLSLDTLKNVYVQILSLFVGLGLFVLFTYIDIDTLGDNWVMLTVFNVVFLLILIQTLSEKLSAFMTLPCCSFGKEPYLER